MSWKKVPLGKFCEIVSGATPRRNIPEYWGGDIAWATPKDISEIDGAVLFDTPEHISEAGYKSCSAKIMPKGSILFSSRAPIGLTAIAGREMCTNQGFKSLVPGPHVDSIYLYYCMKRFSKRIAAIGDGATFKEVSKEKVSNYPIPLPPLAEQKRIAAILEKADTIQRKRHKSIQLANEFLQALFLDMFGDPIINPRKWETKTLNEICNKITDGTHDTPKRLKSGVPFITGKHIKPFFIDFGNCDFVSQEDHKEIIKRCDPQYGDILYTNIGANVGTAAFNNWDKEFSMKNVALLKPNNEKVLSRYLEYSLNHHGMKNKILGGKSFGGAQKFLSLHQINQIKVPLPNISAQGRFEKVVFKISQYVINQKDAEKISTDLFMSLNQRAFRGEL
jgi:type I restriction enzyme, S subunit